MPRLLKRQRSTSNDSVQRKHIKMLDSFDFNPKNAAELAESIEQEIEKWYKPSSGPEGSERIKSNDWVQDIIGEGLPQLISASRVTAGERRHEPGGNTANGDLLKSIESVQGIIEYNMPQRVAASRVTSSDSTTWVREYEEEGSTLDEGPRCSRIRGFGPDLPGSPLVITDDEQESSLLDPATLDILQPLEKEKVQYTDKDVLFGRGGLSNHHIGNKRYRDEADKLKPEYIDTKTTKREKTVFRNRLVDIVHGYGGRFLHYQQANNEWVEVPLKQARRKASQALREDFKKIP